eukprot:scaffold101182_cov74-Phaeocystis_antarctica.AAC.1
MIDNLNFVASLNGDLCQEESVVKHAHRGVTCYSSHSLRQSRLALCSHRSTTSSIVVTAETVGAIGIFVLLRVGRAGACLAAVRFATRAEAGQCSTKLKD